MKTKKSFLWLAFLILATIWILARHNQQANYYNIKGLVFGTGDRSRTETFRLFIISVQ